jgi:hypothetical protein
MRPNEPGLSDTPEQNKRIIESLLKPGESVG